MKLNIKVDGRAYVVEVELADAAPASAASRVEGSAAIAKPAPPPAKPAATPSKVNGEAGSARPHVPAAEPKAPWHDLTVGPPGECVSPVSGTVTGVLVKVGDAVRVNDPLIEVEVAQLLSPLSRPVTGTVRALQAGVVAEVWVKRGEAVGFRQPLASIKSTA